MIGGEREYTPELTRERLLESLSAIGGAAIGIAEALKEPESPGRILGEGLSHHGEELLPLGEEAIEPLIDALRCVIHAVGCPRPLHRISIALDRFSLGDDN